MKLQLVAAVSSMSMAVLSAAPASAAALSDPRTAEAVVALDEAWLQAEIHGDVATLDRLLLSTYVSVSADGRITTRADLLARAGQRGYSPDLAKRVADWRSTHPVRPKVEMNGDTAVLAWQLEVGGKATITSTDIFVYSAGRWRALISQHTTASN